MFKNEHENQYATYSTFSGADIRAYIPFKDTEGNIHNIMFAELQTLTYSTHRVTKNIHALGHQNPIGVVQGKRTIAGSMIFYKFHMNAIDLIYKYIGDIHIKLFDQLPLFNILIIIGNEYGSRKLVGIYGIKLITEGLVMSIQDLTSETTCQFVAMDIEPMRELKENEIKFSKRRIIADQLLGMNDFYKYPVGGTDLLSQDLIAMDLANIDPHLYNPTSYFYDEEIVEIDFLNILNNEKEASIFRDNPIRQARLNLAKLNNR